MNERQVASVLLNASNLEQGGGVQVAASLIDELALAQIDDSLSRRYPWLSGISIEASPTVYKNLSQTTRVSNLCVSRRKWWMPSIWLSPKQKYDLEFVVFGPRYGSRRASITLTGIADGTSVYSAPEGLPLATWHKRSKRAIRGFVSRTIFNRESYLVSESKSLLNEFIRRTGYPRHRMSIVPNVLNAAIIDESLQKPLGRDLRAEVAEGTVLLGYVARHYPHKNHVFLPPLRRELELRGIRCKFVVTLSEDEWVNTPDEFRQISINVGVVNVNQIADLYRQCDGGIFPSLLESFSVTPLEVLATNGLLFASDRKFVSEVCGDFATYIDPLSPERSAPIISGVLTDNMKIGQIRERAAEFTAAQPTSTDRLLRYLEIIDELLRSNKPVQPKLRG